MSVRRAYRRIAVSIVFAVLMPSFAAFAGQPSSKGTAVSRAETEALVQKDLAKRLKVPVDRLTVVSASDQVWPDAGLGCVARKGVLEPTPVPGFSFTLSHAGKRYVYHTDRRGQIKRCDSGTRLGPIGR